MMVGKHMYCLPTVIYMYVKIRFAEQTRQMADSHFGLIDPHQRSVTCPWIIQLVRYVL